jgi:hypothetical protein
VTGVVGRPESCVSLSSAWHFSEPALHEAQHHTQCFYQQHWGHIHFLTIVNVCYWFLLCHREFSNSPVFKTHITIQWHFDDPPAHVPENLFFCCAIVASRTFKIYHRIKPADISCWFWLKYRKLQLFGQPLYYSTLSYAVMAGFEILWKVDLKCRFVGDALVIVWEWNVLNLSIWQLAAIYQLR